MNSDIRCSSIMFVRHGQARRPSDLYASESDVFLTAEGETQAGEIAQTIRDFKPEIALVSPVIRCLQTATLALALAACPIVHDERLRERAFPSLFNLTFDDIRARYGPVFENNLKYRGELVELSGVESISEAGARVVEAVVECASRWRRVVIVSHGGPHSWLCCHALRLELSALRGFTLGCGRYSVFDSDQGTLSLRAMNCGPGLPLG